MSILTRNDIIQAVFRKLGLRERGGARDSEEIEDAALSLNAMIESWQGEGIGLWQLTDARLFLEKSTTSYSIGSTGDHITLSSVSTELSTAGTSGDSTIEVDSISSMTDGDYIGIELDDDSIQWTTINGTPAGSTVTLTATLTGAAAIDSVVHVYTTKLSRPLDVIDVRHYDYDDAIERILVRMSRNEYAELTDKTSKGTPNQYFYDPQMGSSVIYVWQASNNSRDSLVMTAKIPFTNFSTYSTTADFPEEWMQAIIWNLALIIAPEYSKDGGMDNINFLIKMAEESKEKVMRWDSEDTSIYFSPRFTR